MNRYGTTPEKQKDKDSKEEQEKKGEYLMSVAACLQDGEGHQVAPDACLKDDEDKKPQCCTLAQIEVFKDVVKAMGPASRHCCLRHILAMVLEYKGVENLKNLLTHLFKVVRYPALLKELKELMGSNGDHIVAELLVMYHNIGEKPLDSILDAVQPRWKCALEREKNACQPKNNCHLTYFCDPCSASVQNHMDATVLNKEEVDRAEENQEEPELFSSHARDHRHAQGGLAPVWPPGACYNISKPWFTLKCIESFPYNPTQGYELNKKPTCLQRLLAKIKEENNPAVNKEDDDQEEKTTVEETEEESRSHTPKKVRFCDQVTKIEPQKECDDTKEENKTEAGPGKKSIPGYPSYKNYLNDILPVNIPYNVQSPQQLQQPSTLQKTEDKEEIPPVTSDEVTLPPLHACLTPTGNRIQDHLGLRFKTQAHKRLV